MSLIKDNIFLTNVPESERILLMKSNAFRPALVIASNGLFVSHVEYLTANQVTSVRFTDSVGTPIGRLNVGLNDYTYFSTYDSPNSILLATTASSSARPMYVASSLFKRKKDGGGTKASQAFRVARSKAEHWLPDAVKMVVRNTHYKLSRQRCTEMSYRDHLNSEQIGVLLAAFFNEMTPLQVSPNHMTKFEEVRTLRDQRRESFNQVRCTLEQLFSKPKYLVSYIQNHGYRVSRFDVGHSYDKIAAGEFLKDSGVVITQQPEFYRSLEDIPLSKGRDEICGKLTYIKMNLSPRHDSLTWGDNEYALVPSSNETDVIFNEDIFGSAFVFLHKGTLMVMDA